MEGNVPSPNKERQEGEGIGEVVMYRCQNPIHWTTKMDKYNVRTGPGFGVEFERVRSAQEPERDPEIF
jgi:hypothetical protein